jgi:hypothetical protein
VSFGSSSFLSAASCGLSVCSTSLEAIIAVVEVDFA